MNIAFWVTYLGIYGGGGIPAVDPPDVEGIEYAVAGKPLHWRVDATPLHWKTEED